MINKGEKAMRLVIVYFLLATLSLEAVSNGKSKVSYKKIFLTVGKKRNYPTAKIDRINMTDHQDLRKAVNCCCTGIFMCCLAAAVGAYRLLNESNKY